MHRVTRTSGYGAVPLHAPPSLERAALTVKVSQPDGGTIIVRRCLTRGCGRGYRAATVETRLSLSLSLRVCGWVGGFHAVRLLLVNVKSRMYRARKCSELVGKSV